MKLWHAALTLMVCLGLAAGPVAAGRPARALADCVSVVVVLDASGSMRDSDPDFLRIASAKLFLSLLDPEDEAGLVVFSSSATRLTPTLVALASAADKTALIEQLARTAPDGFTDMRAALREAATLLATARCAARYVVLLSDGQPEIAGGLPPGYEAETVEAARQSGAAVLGIALTPGGESGLLFQLAAATGGAVLRAQAASSLLDAFLGAVAHVKDRTVLGSGFSAAPGTATLLLDPGLAAFVDRVTLVVALPPGVAATPAAPGGQALGLDDPRLSFAYTQDPQFAVYSVEAPAPGGWGFVLTGEGRAQVRAILRSRLRVALRAPGAFAPLGSPLTLAVSLIEEARDGTLTTLIGEVAFTALVTRPDGQQEALDQLYDDGSHGDALAGDGVFTNQYNRTDVAGDYQVLVTGHKGPVPVSRAAGVAVVPFPQIVVVSPSGPLMDFRGEPLELAMRLEGGDPPALDSGGFAVHLTGPDGTKHVFPLSERNGVWGTSFAPAQEGAYKVAFSPAGAVYKGTPYPLSAVRSVSVRLIPALAFAPAALDLGEVEVMTLAEGMTLSFTATSSSPQGENVVVELAGAPGLSLVSVLPAEVPPGQSTLFVTVQGELPAGDYAATLLLSVRSGVDLALRELTVQLTVVEPALDAAPGAVSLGETTAKRLEVGLPFELTLTSGSARDETVTLLWEGPPGTRLAAEAITVPAGRSATVRLWLSADGLEPGRYAGQIRFEARRGVAVTPAAVAVSVDVVAPSVCDVWCAPLGGLGLLAAAAGGAGLAFLRRLPRPWGTLTALRTPSGSSVPKEIVLGRRAPALRPSQVSIGSSGAAGVQLAGGQVRPRHAVVRAVRQPVTVPIKAPGRQALRPGRGGRAALPRQVTAVQVINVVENVSDGVVRVNNVPLGRGQQSGPLTTGARVVLGDYEFVYRT